MRKIISDNRVLQEKVNYLRRKVAHMETNDEMQEDLWAAQGFASGLSFPVPSRLKIKHGKCMYCRVLVQLILSPPLLKPSLHTVYLPAFWERVLFCLQKVQLGIVFSSGSFLVSYLCRVSKSWNSYLHPAVWMTTMGQEMECYRFILDLDFYFILFFCWTLSTLFARFKDKVMYR